MYIKHETDIPYIIADKYSGTLKIKIDIEDGDLSKIEILYGDSYDYCNRRDQGWNFQSREMELRYSDGNVQIWDVEIKIPEWKRIKYSFLLTENSGRKILYNEFGCLEDDIEAMERLIDSYHSHFFYPYFHEEDMIQYPKWAESTIWYQIFPDRFARGGVPTGMDWAGREDCQLDENCFYGGDLQGIIDKLDYLKSLGVNGIYLTPVFEADSNHKYDTVDYFKIDPAFGTKEKLNELVTGAHERGMRVILDGVFNHVSSNHPFWLDVLKNQEKSPYADYFCIRKFPVDSSETYSKKLTYETFSFVATMPKLNYSNQKVKEYVISVIEYWIRECDIDGWRFDVGNELSLSFYNELKHRLRPIKDDLYIVAEIWHDANRWFRNGYIDATMCYAIGSAINEYAVAGSISAEAFNKRYYHTMSRLSMIHKKMSFNLLDSHDTERIMTMAGTDSQKVKNAFLMLFLLPGSPCIYYGSEIGMQGKQDPDNRRPMIWQREGWNIDLSEFFPRLIAFRKRYNEWIQEARIDFSHEPGTDVWVFSYQNHRLTLVHNISAQEWTAPEKQMVISTSSLPDILEADSMAVYTD